ncbi:uncharacterized protein LOC122527772 [Frieseomelitta varia]|uniref:uncharacterized protein LOC122527772 n=1 Tax=Frieseomelitta varia TaxID=561572 RepID=UPI001CB6AC17|nr:uncharacterized protein LOC122527772 [Frieseomelitta varia]
MQICTVINISLLLLPTLYAMYLRSDDMEVVSHCVTQALCEIQCIVQTIICFSKHDTLQRILEELWSCIGKAQEHEKEIYHVYLARCNVFYSSYIAATYATVAVGLIGPLFLPIVQMIFAEYPFNVNRTLVIAVVRAHQIITGHQICAHICMCLFGGLLIWFAAARYECLMVELQRTTDIHMLIVCIEKQLRLKRYAEDVVECFRFMVLFVIAACTFVITVCAITIVTNTPLVAKILFTGITVSLLMYIYMYAWPADHMKEMSLKFSQSVYDLPWYEHTARMQKNLLNVLAYQKPVVLSINCLVPELSLRYYCSSEKVSRSGYNGKWYETTLEMQKCLLNVLVYQEPVIFSINCVVPEFSLPYYCSYLSNAFSIFTTLRIALEGNSV